MTADPARPYHHGDLSRALAEAALSRVRTDGADRISLRRVADDVGVSPAAAYHHFRDKDALLRSVASEGERRFAAALRAGLSSVARDDPDPLRAHLLAIGRAYLGFAAEEPELLRLVFHPANAEACLDPARGSAALFRACIDDLAEAGRLTVSAERASTVAWSSVHGFVDLRAAGVMPDAAAEGMLATVVDALVTERSPAPTR